MSILKLCGAMLAASVVWVQNSVAGVVINEVMANNVSAVANGSDYPDWIELYNPGPAAVNLSGLGLTDNLSQPMKFVFPAGSPTLGVGKYYLVWCDAVTDPNPQNIHTGFSFNASGEEVGLYEVRAGITNKLDGLKFGLQPPDYSLGRVPSGTGAFTLTRPTPVDANIVEPLGDPTRLRINEWMARPATGDDWLELYNPNTLPVALGGFYFTDLLTVPTNRPIRALSYIAPDGYLQFFCSDLSKPDPDHLDFKLGSSGETLTLYSSLSPLTSIDRVTFGTQQINTSEGRLPDGGDYKLAFPFGKPTPGQSNFLPISDVVISEVLTHTDLPLEDAVELQNLGSLPVTIGNWWLSNSKSDARRFRIPAGTVIQPGKFAVFYEYQFDPNDPLNTAPPPSFTFNSAHGDQCYLHTADAAGNLTGSNLVVRMPAAENGVSFGRWVTSRSVEYVPTRSRTFGVDVAINDAPALVSEFRNGLGMTNSLPRVGPVVISEIMYHPASLSTNDDTLNEYIELYNLSGSPAPLYNTFDYADLPGLTNNTYRLDGVVSFQFPLHYTLAAEGNLLLVNFDPVVDTAQAALFRAKYGLSGSTPLLGPYGGKLSNSGGRVELSKPDPVQRPPHPDAGFVPMIPIDWVTYDDAAPWPLEADGKGQSLQRIRLDSFGDEVLNWKGSQPTPGRQDAPLILSISHTGNEVVLQFTALPGSSYQPQSATSLSNPVWLNISPAVAAQSLTRVVFWTNNLSSAEKANYFRLSSPMQ